MRATKPINLTQEQIELIIETLAAAQVEVDFASQKKHVMFLPDLFKTFSEHKKDLASLERVFKIALRETYYEKISNLR